ncbi:tyrosine-type recombinase/integrase [Saccharopolyspora sp. NPDC000359]|uniref:tyrosine-type recombinase/integrase n=1 Tax=Saccharopolyspora sp. NPDC000359 TaxID=3154251 RepID=UPI0033262F66
MSPSAASKRVTVPELDDLRELLPDWRRHLRSINRASSTITSYLTVGEEFVDFLVTQGMPTSASVITREHVEHYIVHLQERPNRRTGKPLSAAQVAKHYRSLQQLFRWLDEIEGEITVNPFTKMKAPHVPEQPVPVLTDDELRALLGTCKGRSFEDRRDTALIRFLTDSGPRVGEIAPLELGNLDFDTDVADVLGKGGRWRAIPFGNKTGEAMRRYIRARARHPKASTTDRVWIGRSGALTESGIAQIIRRRGEQAGIMGLHPHMFRHTFAHVFLADGGQEQDLMRLAGWRSREMVGRYGASAADQRAREAHRRAALGDRV